jgi:hypothetical protein
LRKQLTIPKKLSSTEESVSTTEQKYIRDGAFASLTDYVHGKAISIQFCGLCRRNFKKITNV